jgi:sRNA-binding regulator protein Hfq
MNIERENEETIIHKVNIKLNNGDQLKGEIVKEKTFLDSYLEKWGVCFLITKNKDDYTIVPAHAISTIQFKLENDESGVK